jgi:hypothetical protein
VNAFIFIGLGTIIPLSLLGLMFYDRKLHSYYLASLSVVLSSVLSAVYIFGLSLTWPMPYQPVQTVSIVLFTILAYKNLLSKEIVAKVILRLSYSLKDYRAPLFAGGASFLTALVISSVFDWNANPLRSTVSTTNLVISLLFWIAWATSWDRSSRFVAKQVRKSRAKTRLVGILCLEDNKEENYRKYPMLRNADFTPNKWQERLGLRNVPTELVPKYDKLAKFSALLNPFGELYLEKDAANLTDFRKLKNYIQDGGVFVNVGGLAFFYALNPDPTCVETLTGPLLETYVIENNVLNPVLLQDQSSLVDTLLFREFGIRTMTPSQKLVRELETVVDENFTGLQKPNFTIKPFRATLRTEHKDSTVFPILRFRYIYKIPQPESGQTEVKTIHEVFPIAAIEYGAGFILLVGLTITRTEEMDYVIACLEFLLDRLRSGQIQSSA